MTDLGLAPTCSVKPGLHRMSWAEYAKVEAWAAHQLKLAKPTLERARYRLDHPEDPSDPMKLGQANHAAVLEPEAFDKEYREAEYQYKKLKVEKDWWAEAEKKFPHVTFLRPSEYRDCIAMRDAVWAKAEARSLLSGHGVNEICAVWFDEELGLWGKGRLDRYCTIRSFSTVVELKTAVEASPWKFSKAISDYDYHIDAGWRMRGLRILDDRPRVYRFVVVESKPPHSVATYQLADEDIAQGEREACDLARALRDAENTGIWPGYSDVTEVIRLPKWRQQGDDDEQ